MRATATPVFESILLLAFKRALAAYCTALAQLPEQIRVTVGTAEPVDEAVRARFHIVARGLVGSQRIGVVFEDGLVFPAAAAYRIDIDPPAAGLTTRAAATAEAAGSTSSAGPTMDASRADTGRTGTGPQRTDPAGRADPTKYTDPAAHPDPTMFAAAALADPGFAAPTLADLLLADPTLGDPTLGDPTLGDPTLADPTLADPAGRAGAAMDADPALIGPTTDAGPTTGLGPASTATLPRQQPLPPRAGAAELTLRYGEWAWRYTLPDTDTWAPLGRGLRLDDRRAVVRLPDHMAAVPRGALLLIRHSRGETQLCRSDERREYLIDVDGRRLAPGVPQRVRGGGRISYTRGGPTTGLEFSLVAGR